MTAMSQSYNTVPVRLARDELGTVRIAQLAKEMGIETPLRTDKTIPLGTSEVTVLDQATALAVMPAGGVQSRRHGITKVGRYGGAVIYDIQSNQQAPPRVLSQQTTS